MTKEEKLVKEYSEKMHWQRLYGHKPVVMKELKQAFIAGLETKEKENAEAKKLIKNIIRVTWGEGWNYDLGWKVKAEQFINEKFDYLKKDFVNKSVDTNNIKC